MLPWAFCSDKSAPLEMRVISEMESLLRAQMCKQLSSKALVSLKFTPFSGLLNVSIIASNTAVLELTAAMWKGLSPFLFFTLGLSDESSLMISG